MKSGPLVVMSPYPLKPNDKPFEVALNDAINVKACHDEGRRIRPYCIRS